MKEKKSELVFVGCMFVGMGVGYIIDNLVGGMFVGMGIGFIAMIFSPKGKV